jgi:hypothetical protein
MGLRAVPSNPESPYHFAEEGRDANGGG